MAPTSPRRALPCRALALTAATATPLVAVVPATAAELQPHRAVYDLSLTDAEPGADIQAASGRLVFDLSGAACEGFTGNSRFVTRIASRDGATQTTDIRSSTYETLEPATFTFNNRTFVDDVLQLEVKGEARARAEGVAVDLSEPKESAFTLGRAVFPTAHTLLVLDAAAEGERLLEAAIYDGGDSADALWETTTVIGEARTGLPGVEAGERAVLSAIEDAEETRAWRLVMSYFSTGEDEPTGERVPDYEISFTMLENGIAYDVTFDYGTLKFAGTLTELELGEMPDC